MYWRKIFSLVFLFSSMLLLGQKPKIRIVATGGTIAGVSEQATQSNYKAGELGVIQLLKAVPGLNDLAEVSGEQLVKIGSQDMNDALWLRLSKRINELLNKEGYDGVVITHGTDTMEETAYFLHLTVPTSKPIVMVGAMRPATAISADGPINLYNAVVVAADKNAHNRGVMVCMNGNIFSAKDVIKTHTTALETFQAGQYGKLGYLHNSRAFFHTIIDGKPQQSLFFDIAHLQELPKVGIVYAYANASDLPFKALVEANFQGIVTAGVGNGNLYHTLLEQAKQAQQKGIQIVRSSRVPFGSTTLDAEIDDAQFHFVASHGLNPQKARILLMLALTKTSHWEQIQKYFSAY